MKEPSQSFLFREEIMKLHKTYFLDYKKFQQACLEKALGLETNIFTKSSGASRHETSYDHLSQENFVKPLSIVFML